MAITQAITEFIERKVGKVVGEEGVQTLGGWLGEGLSKVVHPPLPKPRVLSALEVGEKYGLSKPLDLPSKLATLVREKNWKSETLTTKELRGWLEKQQVKPGELEWSGVREFLDLKELRQERVSKDELLNFLKMSKIPLRTEIYPRDIVGDPRGPDYGSLIQRGMARYGPDLRGKVDETFDLVVTMPGFKEKPGEYLTNIHYDAHTNEPVLGYARVSVRKAKDGTRTLFVDNMQSDWSGQIKKYGELGKPNSNYIFKDHPEMAGYVDIFRKENGEYVNTLNAQILTKNTLFSGQMAPFPFKTVWEDVLMKALVKRAREMKVDYITLTKGKNVRGRWSVDEEATWPEHLYDEHLPRKMSKVLGKHGGEWTTKEIDVGGSKLPDDLSWKDLLNNPRILEKMGTHRYEYMKKLVVKAKAKGDTPEDVIKKVFQPYDYPLFERQRPNYEEYDTFHITPTLKEAFDKGKVFMWGLAGATLSVPTLLSPRESEATTPIDNFIAEKKGTPVEEFIRSKLGSPTPSPPSNLQVHGQGKGYGEEDIQNYAKMFARDPAHVKQILSTPFKDINESGRKVREEFANFLYHHHLQSGEVERNPLLDPVEALAWLLSGGAKAVPKLAEIGWKGVAKEAVDSGLFGLPSMTKGAFKVGEKGMEKVGRGLAARNLERTMAHPPTIPIPTPLPSPTSAAALPFTFGKGVAQRLGGYFTKEETKMVKEFARSNPNDPLTNQLKMGEFSDVTVDGLKRKLKLGEYHPTPPPNPLNPRSKFVDDSPVRFDPNFSPRDVRWEYTGLRGVQWVKGNNLAADIKRIVPNQREREALSVLIDSRENPAQLSRWLEEPKLAPYRPIIEQALNPTPQMRQAMEEIVTPYFKATGEVGVEQGFLAEKDVLPNYINRLFPKPKKSNKFLRRGEDLEAKGKGLGSEFGQPELSQSTPHATPRQYKYVMDRIVGSEEKPLTLDAADLMRIFNREFAVTNTNIKLTKALKEVNQAVTVKPGDHVPEGWQQLKGTNIAVKDELYNGLRAIIEPNFVHRIHELRGIEKYNGLVKAVDLSLSFFHHFTMAAQALYQTKFGLELLLPSTQKFLRTHSFKEIEETAARYGMMTSNVDANKDVLFHLGRSSEGLGKIINLPGFKQAFKAMEWNNKFLFDDMQKWLKVMDFGKQTSKWIARHPNATSQEITRAYRNIAGEVNAGYGGLNWEALGMTPSFQGLSRLLMLAPDWTYSNFILGGQAVRGIVRGVVGKGQPGDIKAASNFLSSLIGGAIVTEGLSKIINGHYTNENTKGHMGEVELHSSDPRFVTHISLFRGATSDMMRLVNLGMNVGPVAAPFQFAAGKASPLWRSAGGLQANADWDGKLWNAQWSWAKNSERVGAYIAGNVLPVPFGLAGVGKDVWRGVPIGGDVIRDPLVYAIVASGFGRTTQVPKQKKGLPKVPRLINKGE